MVFPGGAGFCPTLPVLVLPDCARFNLEIQNPFRPAPPAANDGYVEDELPVDGRAAMKEGPGLFDIEL